MRCAPSSDKRWTRMPRSRSACWETRARAIDCALRHFVGRDHIVTVCLHARYPISDRLVDEPRQIRGVPFACGGRLRTEKLSGGFENALRLALLPDRQL